MAEFGQPGQLLPQGMSATRKRAPTIGWNDAWRDAYMLDTIGGQVTMLAATANAMDVEVIPNKRRIANSLGPVVEPYNPYWNDDLTGYPLDEFLHSTSPEETRMIKQLWDNNSDLRQNLEGHGLARFFGAGVTDAINIIPVPFGIGKGFWKGAGRASAIGAPIIGAAELARHKIDPTSTAEETFINVVAGTAFMGLMGGIVGAVPKNTMTINQALNRLTPKGVTVTMGFGPIPDKLGPSLWFRLKNAMKSSAGDGSPSSRGLKKGDLVIDHVDGEASFRINNKEGKTLFSGRVEGGKLIVTDSFADASSPGLDVAAYKSAIKWAEDNGLGFESGPLVTKEHALIFKGLEDEGFKVTKNGRKLDDDGNVVSIKDGEPVYALRSQIDDALETIPQNIRDDLAALESDARGAEADFKAFKKSILQAQQKVKTAPKAGGAKTKAQKALDELFGEVDEFGDNLTRLETTARHLRSQFDEQNVKVAQMLSDEIIKDWDLLPTGYNKLLGKLDQMPWWSLIKTPLRHLAPEAAARVQRFALKVGATPGLNNLGNKQGHSTGASIEARTIEYTGKWLSAVMEKNRIYRKMAGHGDSSGMAKTVMMDTSQRVRASFNRARGKTVETHDPFGMPSIAEFDLQISLAIAANGEHAMAEVVEAAAGYMRVLKEMGDEGIELGIFATQKNLSRQIKNLSIERIKIMDDVKQFGMNDVVQNMVDELDLQVMELTDRLEKFAAQENPSFVHRMWLHDQLRAQEVEFKQMLRKDFIDNPQEGSIVIRDENGKVIREVDNKHPDAIEAHVNETYASLLREAETGGDSTFMPKDNNKRAWLEARKDAINQVDAPSKTGITTEVAQLQTELINRKLARLLDQDQSMGGSGPLIARQLDLDDKVLLKMGLIESNVDTWMNHYVQRTAPIIETTRMFGDARAAREINEMVLEVVEAASNEKNLKKKAKILDEAARIHRNATDLIDIVHGTYQIPKDPAAITGRILRLLRNFNILGSMGRSVFMAFGDIGNVMISQGVVRSLRHAISAFSTGISDGNIKMMKDEVNLAGSVSEVVLGMRFHQMAETGGSMGQFAGKFGKLERGMAAASQRFFILNMLGPWTDMARKFSGGMLQSRLIEWSGLWKEGKLKANDITIMERLGISKAQATQFHNEWVSSGSLRHKEMFIANTEGWVSKEAKSVFRAALNTEINRMVPTPGAVDKPKGLLKSEWWKIMGQYRGFSIAATHRIMGAGIHTKGADKYMGIAAMIGIAMIVDSAKRPDYIKMPLFDQVLRAVELSGVTGIVLDLNDTLERMTGGTDMELGIRPMLGRDIRERNPNWASRMGTIGAVPQSWLTLMYGLTSDEASTNEQARAIRYMIPYNNLLWWNDYFNRMQRSSADFIDSIEE